MLSTSTAAVSRRNVSWSKRTLDQYQAQHFYLYCLRSSCVGVTQLTQSLVLMCSSMLFSLDHINRDERAPQSIQGEESCCCRVGGGVQLTFHEHRVVSNIRSAWSLSQSANHCECENHAIKRVIRINAGVFSAKLKWEKAFRWASGAKMNFSKGKIQQLRVISRSSGC